jgi:hypothetical protein
LLLYPAFFYAGGIFFSLQYHLAVSPPPVIPLPWIGAFVDERHLACGDPPWTGLPAANESERLRCSDIPVLEKQALAGSIEAANKIASFFRDVQISRRDSMFWEAVAAEDGDPTSMTILAFDYNHPPSTSRGIKDNSIELDEIRAHFWLEHAAQLGDTQAKLELGLSKAAHRQQN